MIAGSIDKFRANGKLLSGIYVPTGQLETSFAKSHKDNSNVRRIITLFWSRASSRSMMRKKEKLLRS